MTGLKYPTKAPPDAYLASAEADVEKANNTSITRSILATDVLWCLNIIVLGILQSFYYCCAHCVSPHVHGSPASIQEPIDS